MKISLAGVFEGIGELPASRVGAAYVHVPFCFHKCHYCDFYSITRQSEGRMEGFVDLVLAEADGWVGEKRGVEVAPTTVFFGGGTPTLLPAGAMGRLIEGLKRRFDFSKVAEFTVEANPATVTREYARVLREAGVSRVSFGAQSFHKKDLAALERHHEPEEVLKSVGIAREAGFKRVNVDLIFAIPGQNFEDWVENVETAIGLGTEHLSCYGLTYEVNTALAVRRRLGQVVAAEEGLELRMLEFVRKRLAGAGFEAYEISNFAKEGERCLHNVVYWKGGDYVGLGPSAASHVGGVRWKNRAHLGEWEAGAKRGGEVVAEVERLTAGQRAGEFLMLGMRLGEGVGFAEFGGRFGDELLEVLKRVARRMEGMGLVVLDGRGVRLTESGVRVADSVAGEMLGEVEGG